MQYISGRYGKLLIQLNSSLISLNQNLIKKYLERSQLVFGGYMNIIEEKIYQPYNSKKIYILKDSLGYVATGQTYDEALEYLQKRRARTQET